MPVCRAQVASSSESSRRFGCTSTHEGVMRRGEAHGRSRGHQVSDRTPASVRRVRHLCIALCQLMTDDSSARIRTVLTSTGTCRGVPNYQFQYTLDSGVVWDINFTACRGHVMEHAFPPECSNWSRYPTRQLFTVPIVKRVAAVRPHLHPHPPAPHAEGVVCNLLACIFWPRPNRAR
jgi:hypothetical protein